MLNLTPYLDPRRTEYYKHAFPELTRSQREELRKRWIIKNTKEVK